MWQRPHLLLLDEPTNHLDLDAVEITRDYPRSLDLDAVEITRDYPRSLDLDAVEALVFATCPRHVSEWPSHSPRRWRR